MTSPEVQRLTVEHGLAVSLYRHDLAVHDGAYPAWTLVSRGLSSFGQRELSITILRTGTATNDFPRRVIEYIGVVKQFASEGKLVDAGGVSGFRAPGPFELGEFVGLAFFDAPAMAGIEAPPNVLTGVFLTEGELMMAAQCSVRRVLHQLGKATKHFPAPFWSNPLRASVYSTSDLAKSVLARMPRVTLAEATATLLHEVMTLRLPQAFANELAERLAQGEVSAILPGQDPAVQAALVWSPGQTEPEGIVAAGAQTPAVAATFVSLVSVSEANDDIVFLEDGYAAVLSPESARALADALRAGAAYRLHDPKSGRALHIELIR